MAVGSTKFAPSTYSVALFPLSLQLLYRVLLLRLLPMLPSLPLSLQQKVVPTTCRFN